MPELPEVETIARWLQQGREDQPPLPGSRIQQVVVLWERTIAEPQPTEFRQRLTGQVIERVGRRGKLVVITLDRDTLLFHLRMSGDLRVEPGLDSSGIPLPLAAHDRLAVEFESGWRLAFNDARKFGRAWLVAQPDALFARLGVEPLGEAFTADWLHTELQSRRRQIKALLLDQTFIAGVGNIYADEALHLARINPCQPAHTLTRLQAEALHKALRNVLMEGIRTHGASIDWVYRGGDFQNQFRVYRRTGEPCPTCGTPVVRQLLAQRSTHYCPTCQDGGHQEE